MHSTEKIKDSDTRKIATKQKYKALQKLHDAASIVYKSLSVEKTQPGKYNNNLITYQKNRFKQKKEKTYERFSPIYILERDFHYDLVRLIKIRKWIHEQLESQFKRVDSILGKSKKIFLRADGISGEMQRIFLHKMDDELKDMLIKIAEDEMRIFVLKRKILKDLKISKEI